jgi:hypothetical protein
VSTQSNFRFILATTLPTLAAFATAGAAHAQAAAVGCGADVTRRAVAEIDAALYGPDSTRVPDLARLDASRRDPTVLATAERSLSRLFTSACAVVPPGHTRTWRALADLTVDLRLLLRVRVAAPAVSPVPPSVMLLCNTLRPLGHQPKARSERVATESEVAIDQMTRGRLDSLADSMSAAIVAPLRAAACADARGLGGDVVSDAYHTTQISFAHALADWWSRYAALRRDLTDRAPAGRGDDSLRTPAHRAPVYAQAFASEGGSFGGRVLARVTRSGVWYLGAGAAGPARSAGSTVTPDTDTIRARTTRSVQTTSRAGARLELTGGRRVREALLDIGGVYVTGAVRHLGVVGSATWILPGGLNVGARVSTVDGVGVAVGMAPWRGEARPGPRH